MRDEQSRPTTRAEPVGAPSLRVYAYLNEVLSFSLCDKRLELWCRESVDETGFGDDEEKHLGARQDRKFVGLAEQCS